MRAVLLRIAAALSLLIVPAALAGDLTPPGAPGPTMKTLDEVEPRIPIGPLTTPGDASSTYRIDAPGSYYLTGDALGEVDKIGVLVNASDVTLDLSGFTLRGQPGSVTWPAVLVTFGNTNVEVRNGTIAEWAGNGVEFDNSDTDVGDVKGIARDLRIRDCGRYGIFAEVDTTIENCRVTGCADGGIRSTQSGAIVRGCIVTGNGGAGVSIIGGSVVVSDTVALSNASTGVSAGDGAVVEHVTARFNGGDGISVGIGGIARGCVAFGNTLSGFRMSDGASLSGCVSRSNNGDRFTLGVNASVADCTTTNNSQMGVLAGDGLNMRDSAIAANLTGGVTAGNDARISGCNVTGNLGGGLNEGRGIFLLNNGSVASSTISGNAVHGVEGDDGLRVTDSEIVGNGNHGLFALDEARIDRCTLRDNAGAGAFTTNFGFITNNLVDSNGQELSMPGVRAFEGSRIEGNTFSENSRGVRLDDNRNVVVRNSFIRNGSPQLEDVNANNQNALPLTGAASAGPWDNITH